MNSAKLLLLMSVFLIVLGPLQPLWITLIGFRIPYVFSGLQACALPMLWLGHRQYQRFSGPCALPGHYHRINWFILTILLLTLYGLVRGAPLLLVFYDAWNFLFIAAFLSLGTVDAVWRDLRKPLIGLYWIIFAVTLWGLFQPKPTFEEGEVTFGVLTGSRSYAQSLGYVVSKLLDFWPVPFLLSYFAVRGRIWRVLGLATLPAFLVLQVLFQKRAPSARALIYGLVIVMVLPLFRGRQKALLSGVLLICIAFSLYALSSHEAFSLLIGRYRTSESVSEIDRVQEAEAMISDLSWWEFLVGRGMGGSYTAPEGWMSGLEVVSDEGELGRAHLHMGFLEPLLKGGLVLVAVYGSFFVLVVWPKRRAWYDNDYNLAGLLILLVYGLFLSVEGAPTFAAPSSAMLVGLICARGGVRLASATRATGTFAPNAKGKRRRFSRPLALMPPRAENMESPT
jgi:hypothetical protein